MSLKNNGILTDKNLEFNTIRPLYLIYEAIVKLLRDNNIIKTESEESKTKIEVVFKEIMKLQKTFICQNNLNQFDIQGNIAYIKSEIERTLGTTMSQEVEKILMSLTGLLEENFG